MSEMPQTGKGASGGRKASVRYEDGARFPYLGEEYALRIRQYPSYRKPGIMLSQGELLVLCAEPDEGKVAAALREWYVCQAKQVIPERVAHYAQRMGETYGNVRIKDLKSRWGSCSSKRNLNFNWRLVLAPLSVLDYVVVHELCHLKEMNHSRAFWDLVAAEMPDYKKMQLWLRTCRLIEMY